MVRVSRVVRTPSTAEGSCGARRASDLEAGTGGVAQCGLRRSDAAPFSNRPEDAGVNNPETMRTEIATTFDVVVEADEDAIARVLDGVRAHAGEWNQIARQNAINELLAAINVVGVEFAGTSRNDQPNA